MQRQSTQFIMFVAALQDDLRSRTRLLGVWIARDRFMQAEQWLDRTVSDRERCPWGPQQQIRPLCRHGVESMGHPTQHPRRINKKHGRPIQPRCSGANVCHGSTVLPFFFFHPYIQYVCLSVTVIPSHTEDEHKSNAGVVEYCMIGTIPCPHI
jgi:hypothetical protein